MTNLFALIGLLVVGCWLALAVWMTGWWLLLRWRALRADRQRAVSLRSCDAVTPRDEDAAQDIVTEGLGAIESLGSFVKDGRLLAIGALHPNDRAVFDPARRAS